VRSIVNDVLVCQTKYSYTYAQPPRKDTLYNLAHGTLAAEALTPATTRLTYTMLRDDSMLPDDAARRRDEESRRARVSEWLKNMKVLAEGGKLPPRPAGSLRPPITTPFLNPNPHYVSLPMSIVVDAPVQKVWARVGKYCDIGEWGFRGCDLISGKEGEIGAVRTIGHSVIVGQARESRFGMTFVVSDREFVLRCRQERGYGVNAWSTHTRFIISHSLLRDEAYSGPLRDWLQTQGPGSLLILGEAHNAAPASGSRYAIDSKFTKVIR
jgi:hypothetical protein